MLGKRPAPSKVFYGWDVNPHPTLFQLDDTARITGEAPYVPGYGRGVFGAPQIRANPFYYGEVFGTVEGAESALDSYLSR